jgi:DNA-binding transcriptional regulator YiaG
VLVEWLERNGGQFPPIAHWGAPVTDLRTIPTLDQLAEHPERAIGLPSDTILALHARAVRVFAALEAPLLALAVKGHPTDVTPQRPYLIAQEAADYLRIKKSRLDALRREGRVPATKLGKAFTYRRADLESLRESIRWFPLSRYVYPCYTRRIIMRGAECRRIRRSLGLTQVKFAKRLGVTGNTVARWERDEMAIREPMAKLIRLLMPVPKGGTKHGSKKNQ